jgi:hypothetical protein
VTVSTPEVASELSVLAVLVKRMFPHDRFPDGPYERCAASIQAAVANDVRLSVQLSQGLQALDEGGFADLDPGAAHSYLESIAGTTFFETVRSNAITTLYDDREVWAILGYEGPSFAQGGYLHRGFADLDWLPAARIEGPAA